MDKKALNLAIDLLDKIFPSATTAFLTKSSSSNNLLSIQIIVLNEIYEYHTFEYFKTKNYEVEIIIFPKSLITFTDKHFDFIEEYDLLNAISNGILIKDTNSTGEKLQQTYEIINGALNALESNTYKEIFKLSRLINKFEKTNSNPSKFIIKNEIFLKINSLLKNHINYLHEMVKLENCFNNNLLFLQTSKSILEYFGEPITFYSENNILNNGNKNSISIRFSDQFKYDDFVSRFLIYFFNKLKEITSKIKFAFKVIDKHYLITIWTDKSIIENNVIPTLNQIFVSNVKLYNTLKPKYPYENKKQLLDNLIIDSEILKELQIILTQYVLELRLNENEKLSDGYRLSLGILFTIEILQILFIDKEIVKKNTNLIFEEWLSISYDVSQTNLNDLELQSHKILNEFENFYLGQNETLNANFSQSILAWEYKKESGLELESIIKNLYSSYNKDSVLNYCFTNKKIDPQINSLQIILFEVLSILGISNFNKTYIIYAINRLSHED